MKKSFLFIAGLMALTACDKRPDKANIVVLCTTDVHGSVMNRNYITGVEAGNSLSNVSSAVDSIRAIYKDNVILLDAGDFLQGQPSIYYSNFEDTVGPHIQSKVMNFMKYDAAAVGNHDVEPGERVYDRVNKEFAFPWLSANIIDKRTGKPYFKPYTVINKDGIKIAVLGLTTPAIPTWLPENLWPNMEFEDMVESAKKWVPIIQKKEKPDVLIGLFHSGSDYTSGGNNMETTLNENGGIPAATKVDGFDLIFLGHDHSGVVKDIENDFGNTVKVINAETASRFLGYANIDLQKNNKGSYKKEISAELINMNKFPKSKAYDNYVASDDSIFSAYVNKKIGVLGTTLYARPGLYGPSQFNSLIHKAQLNGTKADISMVGLLSTNGVIEKGNVFLKDMFSLYKYENQLYTMHMTGAEVKKFLEYGYAKQYNQMKSDKDLLLNYKKDEKGNLLKDSRGRNMTVTPSFNYISAEGINYTVDVTKEEGNRVKILSMSDGKPFDMNKDYTIAINSYQGSGGGGFLTEGLGLTSDEIKNRIQPGDQPFVRALLVDYISSKDTVYLSPELNWKVIPEKLFEAGKKNEASMSQSR